MAQIQREGVVSESSLAERFKGSGQGGRLTAKDARGLLAAQRASGKSLAQFARDAGIGVDRLRWWQRQFAAKPRTRATQAPIRLLPVRVRGATVSEAPIKTLCAIAPAFDLELPDGRAVRVPADFDPASLKRLLAVLSGVT